MSTVRVEKIGPVTVVTIDRPEVRNAVDRPTAEALADAFRTFEADETSAAAVLTGSSGTFCAGADLKKVAQGPEARVSLRPGDGPMGPTFLNLTKPVIAAVEGFAVAGGLELAIWCDMRVMARDATFGVYCRRWGVPLIDGGTIRLPRLIGHSRAMDLILTGRGVGADEAVAMGLANRICDPGEALQAAVSIAEELSAFPQGCLRSDRRSAHAQWGLTEEQALAQEREMGMAVIRSGETREGAARFASGAGRHGTKA